MGVTLLKEDSLAHIQYANPNLTADDPKLLINQVSSISGRITIVSAFGCSLVLDYAFGALSLHVTVTLVTPVGNVTIVNAELDPSNPTVSLGGSIGPFKAEANVSFNFSDMVLSVSGQVCAPFVGCKKGSTTLHV
jgi:hypothetical protein